MKKELLYSIKNQILFPKLNYRLLHYKNKHINKTKVLKYFWEIKQEKSFELFSTDKSNSGYWGGWGFLNFFVNFVIGSSSDCKNIARGYQLLWGWLHFNCLVRWGKVRLGKPNLKFFKDLNLLPCVYLCCCSSNQEWEKVSIGFHYFHKFWTSKIGVGVGVWGGFKNFKLFSQKRIWSWDKSRCPWWWPPGTCRCWSLWVKFLLPKNLSSHRWSGWRGRRTSTRTRSARCGGRLN